MAEAILYAVGGAALGSASAGLSWYVAKQYYSHNEVQRQAPTPDKKIPLKSERDREATQTKA
jgi:hypothetical protein